MQEVAPLQPTPLPPKPTCLVWYAGDPCDGLIQQYNQAAEQDQQQWQIYVTAPLQKQIADQQKQIADQENQIKTLQLKIESQAATEASNQALLDGIGAVIGAGLAFYVAISGFRRFARNSGAPQRAQEPFA